MDSMLHKLEKYADNLENIVQQRTAQLFDEKQKTDMLLHRMLPTYDDFFIIVGLGFLRLRRLLSENSLFAVMCLFLFLNAV